ncbi:hypothetical protein J3A83DRAFT_3537069 [Scleroderma citrinum]
MYSWCLEVDSMTRSGSVCFCIKESGLFASSLLARFLGANSRVNKGASEGTEEGAPPHKMNKLTCNTDFPNQVTLHNTIIHRICCGGLWNAGPSSWRAVATAHKYLLSSCSARLRSSLVHFSIYSRTTDSIEAFADDIPFPDHDSEYGYRRRLDKFQRKVGAAYLISKEKPAELCHPIFKEKPIWLAPHELGVLIAIRNSCARCVRYF